MGLGGSARLTLSGRSGCALCTIGGLDADRLTGRYRPVPCCGKSGLATDQILKPRLMPPSLMRSRRETLEKTLLAQFRKGYPDQPEDTNWISDLVGGIDYAQKKESNVASHERLFVSCCAPSLLLDRFFSRRSV